MTIAEYDQFTFYRLALVLQELTLEDIIMALFMERPFFGFNDVIREPKPYM